MFNVHRLCLVTEDHRINASIQCIMSKLFTLIKIRFSEKLVYLGYIHLWLRNIARAI